MLKLHEPFIPFSLQGDDGNTHSLQDFAGEKAVLYFYPKDDTPGCTLQAKGFEDYLEDFKKLNAKIAGISPDGNESHCRFKDKHHLNFILLSDPDGDFMKTIDVWGEKSLYGKKYFGVLRTTFLLDEHGIVLKIWEKVHPEDHAEEVLAFIKSLPSS